MKVRSFFLLFAVMVMESAGCHDHTVGPVSPADTSWAYLGLGSEDITPIGLHPTNPDVIYAGSSFDFSAGTPGMLFKTSNGGTSWDTLVTGSSSKYTAIAVDQRNPETVYAVPWGIIKSTDGGFSWQAKDSGIRLDWETQVNVLVMDPFDSNVLYAGTGWAYGGGIYRSTDAGTSWSRIKDNVGGSVATIAIDPTHCSART